MNNTPKPAHDISQTGAFQPVRDGADQGHEPSEQPAYVVQDSDPAITGVIVIRRPEGEDRAKHADDSPTHSAVAE
ncbi:MAG: hypothetical protein ACUVSX_14745 [Aggregatilineales bacterium]